jgi:EmrB/QacA subfamily drug resistance transporter
MTDGSDKQPYLHVSAGRARGTDLLVPDDVMVGRIAERLEDRLGDDPELSRRHARVTRASDGSLLIEDLGSTNGTYVNDEQVRGRHQLRPGDQVWIGSTTLEVRLTPPGELPARWATVVKPPESRPERDDAGPKPDAARPKPDAARPKRADSALMRAITGDSEGPPEISMEPAPIQVSRWAILLVLALGEFMILLDSTIVNVALPSIASGIHASLDEILWVINSYIVAFAVLLITFGRLGDMLGAKNLFIGGLAIFAGASAACGLSNDPGLLIAFRVVQGLGGAMLLPQTLALITQMFPPESRGQAVGVWGAVAGLSIVCGPVIGGVLTTYVGWRAIFFLNVPIAILAIVLAVLLVPRMRSRDRHALDAGGVVLVGAGLAALVFGLVEGQRYNWGRISSILKFDVAGVHASLWSIPTILLYAAVLLVAFYFWERRQPEPLLPLGLFGDRNFSIGSFTQGAINVGVLGVFLTGVVYFQAVLGFSAVKSGLALLPMAGAIMVSSPVGGTLVDKPNGRFVLPVGLGLFACGLAGTVLVVSASGKFIDTVVPFVLMGLGMGLSFTSLTALAVRNISPAQAGPASGFIETAGQIGAAMGTAIVGAVLQLRLASAEKHEATRVAAHLPSEARAQFISSFSHGGTSLQIGQASVNLPHGVSQSTAHLLTQAGQDVFHHAYATAMKAALIGPLGVAALAVAIAFLIRTPKYHRPRGPSESGVFSFPRA